MPRSAPHSGVNAADAMTIAQVAIGLLRQHLRPTDQVHGVVLRGGDAANVVPAHAEGLWMARGAHARRTGRPAAARGALLRGGCTRNGRHDGNREREPPTIRRWSTITRSSSCTAPTPPRWADPPTTARVTFSTDMGNVSFAMPTIHPCIAIEIGRRGESPARVRRRVHQRVGRPRGARRRARDGMDGNRPRDRTAARTVCSA